MPPLTTILFWLAILASPARQTQTANSITTEKIILSGIGEVNYKSTYGDIIKAIGEPDSIKGYTKPIGKSLPYYELYYDKQNLIIRFDLNPSEKFKYKTNGPGIHLFNKSTIELNGILPSRMDSASIVKQYGTPKSIQNTKGELVLSYHFNQRKYF